MFDLISIGDSVLDIFIPLKDAEVIKDSSGDLKLCLRYGDKVPVGPSISTVGGNAANSAVGCARLNLKTAIYTNVGNAGDDRDDYRIIKKLKKERVYTNYVVEHENLPSNHHVVLDFKGERTILTYHQPWKFNLPDLDTSKWIYLTSLPPSFADSSLMTQIVNYIERTGAKLSFNPGTFQIKHGVKKYPRLLSMCELFIVNKEEAKIILGYEVEDEILIKKLLLTLADLGPRKVVVTDGVNGSYGFDGDKNYFLKAFPAKLLEMTGAGDAYATGLVGGLFYGEDLTSAMRWGAANGASVVERIGPQAGLLTYHQMQDRLKEHSKIVAHEM